MKTAIYIEDGKAQVVLTRETEAEKDALRFIREGSSLTVHRGSFYECRGGWIRHRLDVEGHESSTILVVSKPGDPPAQESA